MVVPRTAAVDGPLTASLGLSVYFVTLMEVSTGLIMATPIKSSGMVPDVLKAPIKQLVSIPLIERINWSSLEDHMIVSEDRRC